MPMTILVVEDDEILRWLIIEALTLYQDTLVISCDSADAAKLLLEEPNTINLVLTDVRMPGNIDGLELAQLCWNRWPGLPVIVSSGHCHIPMDQIPIGSAFMAKPWTLAQLYQIVDDHLSKKTSGYCAPIS